MISSDQTSRLFSQWIRNDQSGKEICGWHEIARPQIHGHDLECISFIDNYRFASGAEEKVIRVFEGPKTFLESLENISKIVADETSKV